MAFNAKIDALKPIILVDPELGLIQDGRIAKKYGVNVQVVRRLRQKHGIVSISPKVQRDALMLKDLDLGKIIDRKFGKKYGVDACTIYRLRKKHGIPGAGSVHYHPARQAIEKDPDLGNDSVPHLVLANRHGCSYTAIRNIRRKFGYNFDMRRSGYKPSSGIYRVRERKIDENNKSLSTWKRPKGIDKLLEQINE